MGLDYGPREGKTPVEEVLSQFSSDSILAAEFVGSNTVGVVYAAYKHGEDVVALVVLCHMSTADRHQGQIGTKVMDERLLPYFYQCPDNIFNMLTPTEHPSAQEWRRRVSLSRKGGHR